MSIESINPHDGKTLKTFEPTSAAEVDRALDAAVAAQREWMKTSFAHRAGLMRKVAALLKERAPEYGRIMALEMGKPVKDGIAEANKCASGCEHYAEMAESYLAPRDV